MGSSECAFLCGPRHRATTYLQLYSHKVDEKKVEDVLGRPGDDFPGRNDSRIALGQTEAGRYLQVIYVPDPEPSSVFVITAFDLRGKALAAYRRRRKRK